MPIEHINPAELALFVQEKLPRDRADLVRAHIRICSECSERLVAGLLARISDITAAESASRSVERRAAKRLPRSGVGYVQSICPLSFERIPAEMIDSSDTGIGLLTSIPLAVGALVQVCLDDVIVLGEVRSSRESEPGRYRIGVRLESTVRPRR